MHPVKKFGLRFIAAPGIFAFFNITTTNSAEELFEWTTGDEAYFYFTVLVVLIIWEISDRIVKYLTALFYAKSSPKGSCSTYFGSTLLRLFQFYWPSYLSEQFSNQAKNKRIDLSGAVFVQKTVNKKVISESA